MTDTIIVAPLLVAMAGITLTLLLRSWPRVQRVTSVAVSVAYAGTVGWLAWQIVLAPGATGAIAYQVGGWVPPHGITLVADALSAFMLTLAALVALYAVAFSVHFVDEQNQAVYYHPLFHMLVLGVTGAFLTGDLFNLFVWFEVMLMSSYVFVAFYGAADHTAAGMRYVVVNIVGSALMLLSVSGLYATVGTLNMAEMARRLADPAAAGIDPAPVVGLSALVFATFALKAGLVPFQFWVPSAYRAAPLPIAAMLAGVTKKVGIYAIIRLYFTVYGGAAVTVNGPVVGGASPLSFMAPVLLVMAAVSILLGGLGAVGRERMDGLLAYSSIGQVGFIAVPVAIAAATGSPSLRHLGILAALVYALHHALAKGLLFMCTGVIRDAVGTTYLSELGGLGQRSPTFALTFFVGAVSLVGIPPLAGFFGKFLVFDAAATRFGGNPTLGPAAVIVVLLVGAFLTIVYGTRAWVSGFWGEQTMAVEVAFLDRSQVAILATMAALIVAVGVGFEPVYQFADAAASAALDGDAYIEVVGPGGENA